MQNIKRYFQEEKGDITVQTVLWIAFTIILVGAAAAWLYGLVSDNMDKATDITDDYFNNITGGGSGGTNP